ncbi:MAG: WD40/YVTN/BNR-like repeat-containing protein [Gammaproteobacteria bacterium]
MTSVFLRRLTMSGLLAAAFIAFSPVAAAGAYPASSLQALQWRLVGPFHGGRSDAVAGVPGQPRTFYFGGADGGIWKSTDAGHNWHNVSDCCLAVGSIGALAVAPSDPDVVYAGTGEPFPRGDMATGDGMWKSTDAGKHWQHVGLDRTRVISRILVDPHNPAHVYVAALGHIFGPNPQRGVYETADGGAHWKRILYVNAQVGANDLAMDPRNPNILYASMWRVSRRPWNFSSGGPGSGLYKSTDGGAHWTAIGRNPGFAPGTLGKIGIAVAPSDPNRVYALVEAQEGGLYRSDDGGATWRRLDSDPNLTTRAFYFGRLYVDPANADHLLSPHAEGLLVSRDGGAHFRNLYAQGGDNHVLWINPLHLEDMIVGNDGGATVTLDGGKSWSSEDNQPTGQFYHVAVDDRFPFHIYGSQQDFATLETASRDTSDYDIGRKDWRVIAQWESGYAVPVPGTPWLTYSSAGIGGLLESYDEHSGQHLFFGPWPEEATGSAAAGLKYRFQWTFPVLVSTHDSHALYVGSQYVMKSADGGNSWQVISPDLTRDDKSKQTSSGGPITPDNTSVEYYDTVFALAESPLAAGLLWAGTDDGKVWVTRDDGKHWSDVTPAGLPEWATISIIEPSHFKPGAAYLAARRYRQDDYAPYIYKTSDYGAHWRKITHGLPRDESSFVVREDTQDPCLLFAGTLRGVYVSFDDGGDWQPLQFNLPHSAVRDLAVQSGQSALVAATHGRGFWVLDNLQPLREMSQKVQAAPAFLFTPQNAWLTGGERDPHAAAYNTGENPPNGVAVFYELETAPAGNEPVTLTFSDGKGATLASFASRDAQNSVPARAGMNEFVWDLRYLVASLPDTAQFQGLASGPQVVPGSYLVTLVAGNTRLSHDFTVVKDPTIAAAQDDLEARYTLLREIQGKLIEIAATVTRIQSSRKSLEQTLAQTAADSAHANTIKQELATLDAIQNALLQPQSSVYLASLQQPARLEDKLGMLFFAVDRSFARPTQSDYELWQALAAKVDTNIAAAKQLEAQLSP